MDAVQLQLLQDEQPPVHDLGDRRIDDSFADADTDTVGGAVTIIAMLIGKSHCHCHYHCHCHCHCHCIGVGKGRIPIDKGQSNEKLLFFTAAATCVVVVLLVVLLVVVVVRTFCALRVTSTSSTSTSNGTSGSGSGSENLLLVTLAAIVASVDAVLLVVGIVIARVALGGLGVALRTRMLHSLRGLRSSIDGRGFVTGRFEKKFPDAVDDSCISISIGIGIGIGIGISISSCTDIHKFLQASEFDREPVLNPFQ